MEASPGPSDLQEQLKEREAEVGVLRDRLGQAQEEMDRLRRENEQLRKELRAAGRGSARGQSKRKAKRKRSGRKAGKGRFTFRGAPATAATNGPPPSPAAPPDVSSPHIDRVPRPDVVRAPAVHTPHTGALPPRNI